MKYELKEYEKKILFYGDEIEQDKYIKIQMTSSINDKDEYVAYGLCIGNKNKDFHLSKINYCNVCESKVDCYNIVICDVEEAKEFYCLDCVSHFLIENKHLIQEFKLIKKDTAETATEYSTSLYQTNKEQKINISKPEFPDDIKLMEERN